MNTMRMFLVCLALLLSQSISPATTPILNTKQEPRYLFVPVVTIIPVLGFEIELWRLERVVIWRR